MARRPAHLEMTGGKGPRQRVWELIRKTKGQPFERIDVIPNDVNEDTARSYLKGLENAGYIALAGDRAGTLQHYRVRRYVLVNDAGVEAPRVRKDGARVTMGLAQEQMWRTLRRLKGDTNARELAACASTPEVAVSEVAAGDYLRTLHYAGYTERTQEGKGTWHGGVQARYRLVQNTGPRPPMICRADALYDPNVGEIIWMKAVTEEDVIYGK